MATLGIGAVVTGSQAESGNLPTQQQNGERPVSGFSIPVDFSSPTTWVAVIFIASVAYLLGAYIVIRGYRVPV